MSTGPLYVIIVALVIAFLVTLLRLFQYKSAHKLATLREIALSEYTACLLMDKNIYDRECHIFRNWFDEPPDPNVLQLLNRAEKQAIEFSEQFGKPRAVEAVAMTYLARRNAVL